MKVFLGKIIHGINNNYIGNNNNGNNKKTATYNVSFPHSESVSLSTPKVLNVHFPTFCTYDEHGARRSRARRGRAFRTERTRREHYRMVVNGSLSVKVFS